MLETELEIIGVKKMTGNVPREVRLDGGIIKCSAGDNEAAAICRLSDARVYCAPPAVPRPCHGNAYTVISA